MTITCPSCSATAVTISGFTSGVMHVTLHHESDCKFYEGDHGE